MDLKPEHITVVNKYKNTEGGGIFIGRPSPLGNPFSHLDNVAKHVTKVGSREEAVSRYGEWLDEKITSRDTSVIQELNRLLALAQGGPIKLVCFCAPKSCHGDVIRERLLQRLSKLK